MSRFLRLFPQFRELEAMLAESQANYERQSGAYGDASRLKAENETLRSALDESQVHALRLQDRLDGALEDRNRMWGVMQDCISGERAAYQAHINASWQKQGGGIPYPDAPHLPESATPKQQEPGTVGRAGRQLPSEAVEARGAAFLKSHYAKNGAAIAATQA